MNSLWPKINDYATAQSAAKNAASAALFISGVTGTMATLSILVGHPMMGISATAFVDVALFALIGWRIGKHSRIAAVFGLVLYLFEVAHRFITHPASTPAAGAILTVVLILYFLNGVRGTLAVHRFPAPEQQPAGITVSAG